MFFFTPKIFPASSRLFVVDRFPKVFVFAGVHGFLAEHLLGYVRSFSSEQGSDIKDVDVASFGKTGNDI